MSRYLFIVFSFMMVMGGIAVYKVFDLNSELKELEAINRVKEEELQKVKSELDETRDSLAELEESKEYLTRVNNDLEDQVFLLEEVINSRRLTYNYMTNGEGTTMEVESKSGFTSDMFEEAWKELGADGMIGTGDMFIKAEKETGINSVVLASIAILESGWNRSKIAVDKNNMYGFGAYDRNPYYYARSFNSREEGTLRVAQFIKEEYLSPTGRYYNGGDLRAIGKRYATDPHWDKKVSRVGKMVVEAAVLEEEKFKQSI